MKKNDDQQFWQLDMAYFQDWSLFALKHGVAALAAVLPPSRSNAMVPPIDGDMLYFMDSPWK